MVQRTGEEWNFEVPNVEIENEERTDGQVFLSSLPVLRKKETKEKRSKNVQSVSPYALGVLQPEIINQLTSKQESWLTVRLATYSDLQANRYIGISKRTLDSWLDKEYFRKAYEVVTMDHINLTILLNRALMVRVKREQMNLLDHPRISIRLRVMDQLAKENAAVVKINNNNFGVDENLFEELRRQIQANAVAFDVRDEHIAIPEEAVGLEDTSDVEETLDVFSER